MYFIEAALPTPINRLFTYAVPDIDAIYPGMRVEVQLRNRPIIGICWKKLPCAPANIPINKIKPITNILDQAPIFSPKSMEFIEWLSHYYHASIGELCKMALPSQLMTLNSKASTPRKTPFELHALGNDCVTLTPEQDNILNQIIQATQQPHANLKFLLHGITGSGKTEIYFLFFKYLQEHNQQGLLLVPEIGLTPQLTGRAVDYFGDRIAIYHSGLTHAQRLMQWQKIYNREVDIVIGTRSALFTPLSNLGGIIIDEEHDHSFKQDQGIIYHARDSAVMRAHIENIPIILGSATPSLESIHNTRINKYTYLTLNSRPGKAILPKIHIIDMKKKNKSIKKPDPHSMPEHQACELLALSPELYHSICNTLSRKEQIILFVGRRGFSPSVMCINCGEVLQCPNCDIPLSSHNDAHQMNTKLHCHYCDYQSKTPSQCPFCHNISLLPVGYGTERLESEIHDFFPNAHIARLDSDLVKKKSYRETIFKKMRAKKIDILIGTQMITKGHDFSNVTLVGVINADQHLCMPDFRSPERAYQLLTQVAGRAGRGDLPGTVFIQTHQPEHYCFDAIIKNNMDLFLKQELNFRKEMNYPPYTKLATLRLSGNNQCDVIAASHMACQYLQHMNAPNIHILGPAPANIERIKNKYRWQLLIKGAQSNHINELLKAALPHIHKQLKGSNRLHIDIDPIFIM